MKSIALLTILMILFTPSSLLIAQSGQTKRLVIIDAAHGGADGGVIVTDKVREKQVTLVLSQLLQKELAKNPDIQVKMTRTSDKVVSADERRKIANSAPAGALFISLHVNAGFGKNATGYEIYFPGFKTAPEDKVGSKAILRDMVKNKSLNDSVRFAQILQRNMERVFPRKGRGLRDAPMATLNDLSLAAVVLEIGFATNADDREKVMDGKTRQAIVEALSNSIREFF
ncbi:MAG: N-acetylmuramoyl-L-alanine amidase [Pseudomonadota bacterium]